MKSRNVIAVCCLAATLACHDADALEWTEVSRTSNSVFWMQLGSLRYDYNRAGEKIVVANVRIQHTDNGRIVFEQNYVRTKHCDAGAGKLASADLSGTFKYDNEFFFNGGNAASSIAELICLYHGLRKDKGI